MAIRPELSADRARGPGYGRLRISGWRSAGPIRLALRRNQASEPFLGHGGVWQASEAWHPVSASEQVGDDIVVAVGPEIVDPIVSQPTSVAYLLIVADDTRRDQGAIKLARPLLGSGAAAAQRAEPPSPPPPPAPAIAAPPQPEPVPVPAPPTIPIDLPTATGEPETARHRSAPLLAIAALALLGGGAAVAWYTCLIPGRGPTGCPGATTTQVPAVVPADAKAAPRSCDGLDGAACFEVARRALAAGELEPARQLFQQAGELGSLDANTAVARMYDPATWSAASSPAAKADWETAVYWYETAARKDDVAGKLGAGRLLCENAPTDFERKRGLEYLRAAAAAGSAEAKPLVDACAAKAVE